MLKQLKPFEYIEPRTIEETLKVLYKYGAKAKVLAGGTDLLVPMRRRELNPQYIVYIGNISVLNYIKYDQKNNLRIGALTTHQSIVDSALIRDKFGLLATACAKIGGFQIRTMGTIGGNICMAGPSQDSVPSLLVLDAKLKLMSIRGARIVPVDEFFVAPFQTVLNETELLTEIQMPTPPPKSAGCYRWLTKITKIDETLVGVAVLMTVDSNKKVCEDAKIGLCSIAPTPIRAKKAEELLRGETIKEKLMQKAAEVAAAETSPRSRAEYRRRVTMALVRRAISEVWNKLTATI